MTNVHPTRSQIEVGTPVVIQFKGTDGAYLRDVGIVEKLLTNTETHPHGIKVLMDDGKVGRVKAVSEFTGACESCGDQLIGAFYRISRLDNVSRVCNLCPDVKREWSIQEAYNRGWQDCQDGVMPQHEGLAAYMNGYVEAGE